MLLLGKLIENFTLLSIDSKSNNQLTTKLSKFTVQLEDHNMVL